MESTSEIVQRKEQSNLLSSTVTKECFQEVSATSIQKLSSSSSSSSSSLEAEGKSNLVALDSDILIGSQLVSDNMKITPPSLQTPDDGNTIDTTSLQNEFIAMGIKDKHGNEIGQLMQRNQQKQSVKVSSAVTADGESNTSTSLTQLSTEKSSSIAQQTSSATSVVTERQQTSSSSTSVSCSSFSSVQKQEIVPFSTSSLSSMKSSQSIEKVVKSSITVIEDETL